MKTNLLDINGKKVKEIKLPKCFSEPIREDIISKVLEAKKKIQAYGASPIAGQRSASGNIRHRRHVWKTHYGMGMSRIPRKTMSKRGRRFNWIGAVVPSAKGGRRAHPPKAISINSLKINKKEEKIAFNSALSATANAEEIKKKYSSIDKVENVPFVVEGKFTKLKTKEIIESLKKILGDLYCVAIPKKSIRAGKGKLRGRKYKKNAGVLIVTGKDEKLKISGLDVKRVNELSVLDLAKGGQGRLVVYTEKAIEELEGKEK